MDSGNFQTLEEKKLIYQKLNQIHLKQSDIKMQVNDYIPKYKRVIYLPFYLGFRLAKILHLNYVGTFLLAKFFNFLCYILLMYFAIKMSTFAKKIVFLISLLVSNVYLSVQFSYDPTITGGIVLSLCLFLRMLEDKKLNKKYLISFVICIIWASLSKAIYAPLLLLLLLLPNNKFHHKKQAYLLKTWVLAVAFLLLATYLLPLLSGSAVGDPRGGNTNAGEQMKLILANPISYCKLLVKFYLLNGSGLIIGVSDFIGTAYLSDCTGLLSPLIYISNLILLLYYVFREQVDKKILTNKIKIGFSIILVSIYILIASALYVMFTPVGSDIISGVQARYFIPLLLLLLLIIIPTSKKARTNSNNNNNILLLLLPFISIMLTNFFIVYKGLGI